MALVYAGLTIPPAAALNAVAEPRKLAAAGARALVPLTYGTDRVPALILNVVKSASDASKVLVQCLWGYACTTVDDPRLNDQALPGGTAATHYTGSQSGTDAALVAAFAAQGITYNDTLAGYAYSVFALPVLAFDGQLNFSARVAGRKLYDPRKDSTNGGAGSHRLATPATWEYSDNPALALADWLTSTAYGAGEAVLWSGVITAANHCDALIGSPSEKRRLVGVTLSSASDVPTVADALRAYAGCWLVPTSVGIKLLPDADGAAAASYAHASGQIAALDALALRDLGNVPTVVDVIYTDTAQIPWRDATATAQVAGAGTTLPWRLSSVRLPGVQRYSQAYREAVERLNKLQLNDLSTALEVFDAGIAHDVGDIVNVSHPLGLAAKPFRVTDVDMPGPGRWRLQLVEHDPGAYSTAVTTTPSYADTSRVSPAGPPSDVGGLAAAVVAGGARIYWTPAPDVDYAETELRVGGASWALGVRLFRGRASEFPWLSPAVATHTVRAKHYDADGNESVSAASINVTVSASGGVSWTDIAGRPADSAILNANVSLGANGQLLGGGGGQVTIGGLGYTGALNATNGATWGTNLAGRPLLFRAMSRGNSDTQAPFAALSYTGGLANAETNTMLVAGSVMYTVMKISRASGASSLVGYYDTLNGGAAAANAMAAALNAIGSDHIVVVTTFDEPRNNRTLGNLPDAMCRCGASRAVFGSPQFQYRAAYVLVGIAGCGEGNGYEAYSGSVASDTNAWCDVAFTLQSGQLIVSGNAATPRTLADYSYVGSLSATDGAAFGVNIGGQITAGNASTYVGGGAIGTPQLASGAVTQVVTATTEAVTPPDSNNSTSKTTTVTLGGITMSAAGDGKVMLLLNGNPYSQAYSFIGMAWSSGAPAWTYLRCRIKRNGTIINERAFDYTGVYYRELYDTTTMVIDFPGAGVTATYVYEVYSETGGGHTSGHRAVIPAISVAIMEIRK